MNASVKMSLYSFLCLGKVTPLTLWILDHKGKTLNTETSSMAAAVTEMENSKDETRAARTVQRGKFEHH